MYDKRNFCRHKKTAFFLATPLLSREKRKLLIKAVIYWLFRSVFSFSSNPGPCTGAEAGHTWFEEMPFLFKELPRKSPIVSMLFLLPYQSALLAIAPIWLLSSKHLFMTTACRNLCSKNSKDLRGYCCQAWKSFDQLSLRLMPFVEGKGQAGPAANTNQILWLTIIK